MDNFKDFLRFSTQGIADELVSINEKNLLKDNISGFGMKGRVVELVRLLKAALFPTLYEDTIGLGNHLSVRVLDAVNAAALALNGIVRDVLINSCELEGKKDCGHGGCAAHADEVTVKFMSRLTEVRRLLTGDITAAYEGDPAARNFEEILLSYPSIEAICTYRMAHELFLLEVPLVPRIMTERAHEKTGIDIHPGATIGSRFFIDHGTGVVIGETAVIGSRVKLYQGVTLGAKSFELDEKGNPVKGVKRHPNIEDGVVIYAGATILGGNVTVGKGSVIGGNVWLTESVPPGATVLNATPKPIIRVKEM